MLTDEQVRVVVDELLGTPPPSPFGATDDNNPYIIDPSEPRSMPIGSQRADNLRASLEEPEDDDATTEGDGDGDDGDVFGQRIMPSPTWAPVYDPSSAHVCSCA